MESDIYFGILIILFSLPSEKVSNLYNVLASSYIDSLDIERNVFSFCSLFSLIILLFYSLNNKIILSFFYYFILLYYFKILSQIKK